MPLKKNKQTNIIFITLYFKSRSHVDTAIWMHHMDALQMYGDKALRHLYKNVTSNIEQVLRATHHKAEAIRPPTTHHENYQS